LVSHAIRMEMNRHGNERVLGRSSCGPGMSGR
jgi:hypothetical protein